MFHSSDGTTREGYHTGVRAPNRVVHQDNLENFPALVYLMTVIYHENQRLLRLLMVIIRVITVLYKR